VTIPRSEEIQKYLSGERLYGDDFSDAEIQAWFDAEQEGYFDLTGGSAQEGPQYQALDSATLFKFVRGQTFALCVALGSARGWDVEPLAPQVDSFIAVEPATRFWRDSIGGKPTEYRSPMLRGDLDLAGGSVDVVVAISVLHHIPNVSEVLQEIYRVLAPGGYLLLREPICSMGDWRLPRHGLTRNERGLPAGWLEKKILDLGFEIQKSTLCNFAPLAALCVRLGLLPYQNNALVRLDLLMSWLTAWNASYDRQGLLRKFAPAAMSLVARKSDA
jgi:SAM-dependent methyltransferase